MDPNLQAILLGLLTNGLTTFIAQFGRKDSKLILSEELLKKIKWEETALQPILQRGIQSVTESIKWQTFPSLEVVCLFLSSPEAETILRQIYAAKVLEQEDRRNLTSIRKEFLNSFYLFIISYSSYADVREEQLIDASKVLLETLIEGCEEILNSAIDNGILSAHEAKSTFRHKVILNELEALKENITFLTLQKKPDIKAILEFENKYCQQVGSRHGYIIPPNFDRVRKLHIDDLYVCPKFISQEKRETTEGSEELNLAELLSSVYRTVILGNPGAGKSTFAHKVCHDLATHYSERLLLGRKEVTPILVILREFGAKKKSENCSILEFIVAKANADYQVSPPPNTFEYLLLNGRAVVIFDGLDELLDTSHRLEITSDVESFCNLYPSAPVIVTSREVGYEQAPLDEGKFELFHLAPFNPEQVQEYVEKWFGITTDLVSEQQKKKTKTFIEESQIVPDLQSNPLMLALLCNIYREENYIPKNRPDVYEKCATMLFERWDKSRGIRFPLPFEAHIRPAMMYLAYWIYTMEELRMGVTEESLIEKTREYLYQRLYEDPDEANKAAHEFIDFCKGRAWVFTNIGSTKDQELYQFTHQTFLEYFAAGFLCRTHPTPASLITVLRPRIAKREWDVVAQLAFQILYKNVEGAGDKLLATLIKQAHRMAADKRQNLLSFVARCLEFIVPNPKVVRDITTMGTAYTLAWGLKQIELEQAMKSDLERHSYSTPMEIFNGILNATNENRSVVADCLEKLFIEQINNGSENEALLALELSLNLAFFSQNKTSGYWNSISEHIIDNCLNRIVELCPKNFELCYEVLLRNKVSLTDFIDWHGTESLFRSCSHIFIVGGTIPGYQLLVDVLLGSCEEHHLLEHLPLIKEFGHVLLSSPLPWIKQQSSTNVWNKSLLEKDCPGELAAYDPDTFFSIFVLIAIWIELGRNVGLFSEELIQGIKGSRLPLFKSIRWIFLARFEQVELDRIHLEIGICGFNTDQQVLIWQWIHKEVNFAHDDANESKQTSIIRKVLIADDDRFVNTLYEFVIQEEIENVLTTSVENGIAALAHIAQEPPSLLLLDLVMPYKSGYEVLKEIVLRDEKFPIIVISAFAGSKREIAAKAGIDPNRFDFLEKPFDYKDLLAMIEKNFSRKG